MNGKQSEENIQQLFLDCKNSHPKAPQKLFDILSPKMFSICLRYCKNREDAEDCLQEGFYRLFKNMNQFQDKGSLEGWCKRIFINICIENYRKSIKDQILTDFENKPEISINPSVLNQLKAMDLMKLVQALPTGYRTVFNLFAIEGYSHEEISEMLKINVNTSKSQLFKARQHLQEIILKQNLK